MSRIYGCCFTAKSRRKERVLNSSVQIENAFDKTQKTAANAIWDTGATSSLITPKIANALQLLPFQKAKVSTPSGSHDADVYLVTLYLPNKVIVPNIKVLSGVPANCDMLIGMDVIGLGDFAVSNYGGKTTFSFRVPSCSEIDFCKDGYLRPIVKGVQPGRNDLCPCGSGKKYKKCCGK
ncbi:SEC-C metal-binding domain-containing protein [Candidatus Avelusimicrobium fimicolum]|uniref:SEC-C metal-binding domain-containing protein n=1 Tax=Candidatus Avelusimicrobium fimicolum TaxID=3416216 RepID=UPI003D0C2920